jgi:hypothetical protein
MKTMDEALAVVCPEFKTAEEAEARAEDFKLEIDKRREFHREAHESQHVAKLIEAMIFMIASQQLTIQAALFSVFVNGMFVGIEMEKAE